MRARLVLCGLAAVLAACEQSDPTDPVDPDELAPPSDLSYQLMPSGDPNAPEGVLLRWTDPGDGQITNFVVYSRASTADAWGRRAETTSSSFHDLGVPHLQYYVASQDAAGAESRGSNTITVDERNQLPTPSTLTSISLDRAVHLAWSNDARLADPALFDYYRVYSTIHDLDRGLCDGNRWVLEGTTVSEDFLASGLANGSPRCFTVSTISRDGHESMWTVPRADTPRFDARNVVVFVRQESVERSGFRFYLPTSGTYGSVLPGNRSDLDFFVDRYGDGSLWLRSRISHPSIWRR